METDTQLLTRFARDRSQEAFSELVSRHIDLVYASARRQVRDSALAEDITQGVFLMLSQKASRLRENVVLPAWLLTATWYASKNALRTQRRRKIHEQRAAEMNSEAAADVDHSSPVSSLDPVLDDALASLSTTDRSVVVLHYLNGKDYTQIATEMASTPEAIRKRSERAIDKLRNRFAKSGMNLTASAVAIEMHKSAAVKAPAALKVKITSTATAGLGASLIAKGAFTMMSIHKLKVAACAAVVVALVATSGTIIAAQKTNAAEKAPAEKSAAETQPTDPRGALIKLAKAIRDGDEDGVKSGMVPVEPEDQPLIDQQAHTCKTVADFVAAYRKAFGDAAARRLPPLVGPTYVPPSSPVAIEGDSATVTVSGVPITMVRSGQTWKMPSSMLMMKRLPMPMDQLVEFNRRTDIAMAETTEAINLGQFQKPQEAMADLMKRTQTVSDSMTKKKSKPSSTTKPASH